MSIASFAQARMNKAKDNREVTPADVLKAALADLQDGSLECEGLLVITMDTGEKGENFSVGFYASNLKSSTMVALCEVMKVKALGEMGYVDGCS